VDISFDKIGLIAGEGDFPIIFARNAKEKGIRVIAVGIKGKTKKELSSYVQELCFVKLGQLNRLLSFLKKHSITQAVMAGKVPKVSIFNTRLILDGQLQNLLKSVKDKKDDSLLKAVARYLEENGITLLESTMFLEDCLPDKAVLTSRQPTEREYKDIEFARTIAKDIAGLDIGQMVVVKDKTILAVEAIEHTDETIKRAGKFGRGDIVVVKVSRPNQDMRFDVPVVGLDTVKSLKRAKATVLAVEAKKTLFMDKDKVIEKADKEGISIVVF